jgi:hypothetical protein
VRSGGDCSSSAAAGRRPPTLPVLLAICVNEGGEIVTATLSGCSGAAPTRALVRLSGVELRPADGSSGGGRIASSPDVAQTI